MAVKGMTAGNYKKKLDKASPDDKFEFIVITVVVGNCTYAHNASGTKTEIISAINNKYFEKIVMAWPSLFFMDESVLHHYISIIMSHVCPI